MKYGKFQSRVLTVDMLVGNQQPKIETHLD